MAPAALVSCLDPHLWPHFGLEGQKAKDHQREREASNEDGVELGWSRGWKGLKLLAARKWEKEANKKEPAWQARQGTPRQVPLGGCSSACLVSATWVRGATAPPSGRWRGTAVRALVWPQKSGGAE